MINLNNFLRNSVDFTFKTTGYRNKNQVFIMVLRKTRHFYKYISNTRDKGINKALFHSGQCFISVNKEKLCAVGKAD